MADGIGSEDWRFSSCEHGLMRMSLIGTALLAAVVLLPRGGVAAQTGEIEAVQVQPPIGIAVDCTGSPERVTVMNNRARPIRIRAVGSIHARRSGEPYKVRTTIKPGRRANYTFGAGKGNGKRLSRSFIFDNDSPAEGVLVKTNKGNFRVSCSVGTNVPAVPPADAPDETPPPPQPGEQVDARELLERLQIAPEVHDDYERELFAHWIDADGDGCDTRREVLIEESLTSVVIGADCDIEHGTWLSAADGDTLTNPASMDINHVVPLKEAWASGAHAWTPERREAFANDLLDGRTLQAVSAGVNRQQGENDPATWLPIDRDTACAFVVDWVAIKASWGLTIDPAEHDAIALTLEACPEHLVVVVPRGAGNPL